MTLFEAQTGGAFDRLNWQHSGEFDQNFSQKSNAPGFARGGWAVLELIGTLHVERKAVHVDSIRLLIVNLNAIKRTQLLTEYNTYLSSRGPWLSVNWQ